MMIELRNVTKYYGSRWSPPAARVSALEEVTLSIERGASVGIVGLNGAGKSTLLKLLLGYVRPTAGEASVGGMLPRHFAERRGVAYVPEHVAVPRRWSVRRALTAYAMLSDLAAPRERVDAVIARLGLEPLSERPAGKLSKGNLQRLGIAQALLGDRELMVLDEPTDGLDPVWTVELRKVVAEWRAGAEGRTAVIASHNLTEIERMTERVLVLHGGRLRADLRLGEGEPPLENRFLSLVTEWGEGR